MTTRPESPDGAPEESTGGSTDLPVTGPPVGPTPERDPADLAAQAALSVEGVTGLHGGSFGEVATYLPGRQVAGVTVRDAGTTVHLAVAFGSDLRQVADEVRRRVAAVAPEPVEVVVEDVTSPSGA